MSRDDWWTVGNRVALAFAILVILGIATGVIR